MKLFFFFPQKDHEVFFWFFSALGLNWVHMISTWFLIWFGLVWNFDTTRFDARTYMSTTSSARAHAIHTLRALDRHKRIWITLDWKGWKAD